MKEEARAMTRRGTGASADHPLEALEPANSGEGNDMLRDPSICQIQAPADEFPVGAAHPLTRRGFMKRAGGATAATLVGWNLAARQAAAKSNYLRDGSNTPDWRKHIMICTGEPSDSDYHAAVQCIPPPGYAEGDQEWRKLPHIDISGAVQEVLGTVEKPEFRQLTDEHGNGYSFHLVHWLSGGELVRQGDYVAACVPVGILSNRLSASAAIVMGRWTYGPSRMLRSPERRQWVYSTVCKITGLEIKGFVAVTEHCPDEKAGVAVPQHASSWVPMDVDGKRVGWLNLSQSFAGTPAGVSVRQRYRCVATFVPRAILKKMTDAYASVTNVAALVQRGGTAGREVVNLSSELGLKSLPLVMDRHLDWHYGIFGTDLGIQCDPAGNSYPSIPERRDWLP